MLDSKTKRIVLIGFRGVGKSTIGRLLAQKLGWEYISTDEEIELRENEPIGHIVSKNGWDYFRKLEAEAAERFSAYQHVIVDTGGGIVNNEDIMNGLVNSSMVIWIDADIETISHRLQNDKDRPLLSETDLDEDIKINYQRRAPVYQKYSELRFNTSNETAEEICDKIISEMR